MTEAECVGFLLNAGLLEVRHLLGATLRVQPLGGRNVAYRVTTHGGPAYLVKQSCDGGEAAEREAETYRFLHTNSACAKMRDAVPELVYCDRESNVLVLELVDGDDLRRYHARLGRCPVRVASRSGRVLGLLHSVPIATIPGALRRSEFRKVRRSEPAALHHPNEQIFRVLSQASIGLVAMVQADDALCEALDDLEYEWRPETLIHDDIRWDNFVIARSVQSPRSILQLVDWESATVGDPDWDLGCLFAEYISHWLVSIPTTRASAAAENLGLARYPIDAAQHAVSRAWASYVGELRLTGRTAAWRLRRASRYVGLRLVERALELDQRAASCTVAAVCHLQVGARILADPDHAAGALLGVERAGRQRA
jgi:aminoglycoside phosphotransferase (APT) family kinase protein